jgi:hypothetical protein
MYDHVIREVAASMADDAGGRELRVWLLSLVPGEEDEEHVGYGPWFRKHDQELVPRHLDLRELTPENQALIKNAIVRAHAGQASKPQHLRDQLRDLAEMVARSERGEPPETMTDFRDAPPLSGDRRGPGWDREGSAG